MLIKFPSTRLNVNDLNCVFKRRNIFVKRSYNDYGGDINNGVTLFATTTQNEWLQERKKGMIAVFK